MSFFRRVFLAFVAMIILVTPILSQEIVQDSDGAKSKEAAEVEHTTNTGTKAKSDAKNPDVKRSSLFDTNPVFGDYQNRLVLAGMSGFDEHNLNGIYDVGVHYSQPNHLFRLPGRMSAELEVFFLTKGFKEVVFGLAQDITLPFFVDYLYYGVGIGIYIRSHIDTFVGSAFNFGEKVFFGYREKGFLSNADMDIEIFVKHYSNGSLRLPNIGFNFFGVSVGFLFGKKQDRDRS